MPDRKKRKSGPGPHRIERWENQEEMFEGIIHLGSNGETKKKKLESRWTEEKPPTKRKKTPKHAESRWSEEKLD